MPERNKRFLYEKGDFEVVVNQCKNCRYNENKPLSCQKYARIPNGTRSGKAICPYREERK